MTRESLGQVRIYRYTCDQCGTEAEHRIRGSRQITRPDGWSKLIVQIGDNLSTEAEVCSAKCASGFVTAALTKDLDNPEGPTP